MSKVKMVIAISILLAITVILYSTNSINIVDKNGNEQKITLKIVTNRTDLVDSKLKHLANEYESLHPDIEIVFEGIKQPNDLLKIRAAVGESADITIVPTDISRKSLSTFYKPIDDLGFNSKNLNSYSSGLGSDNRLYAVNSGVAYCGIVYNKNSFKKAGIEKIPKTLEEFYDDCDKLKKDNIIPFAINLGDEWPLEIYSDDFALPMEKLGDSDYSNELLDKDLFSNDGGLSYSLNFLKNMKDRQYIEPNFMQANWSNFKIKHAKGEIAMTFLGSWYPNQLIDFGATENDIGMFPFPDTDVIVEDTEWLFAISKDSKHLKESSELFKWLFYDGKYAEACDIAPAVDQGKSQKWFLNELLSYNKKIILGNDRNKETLEAFNEFNHPLTSIFKEYLTSDNPNEVIEKYNKRWRQATNKAKENNEE
ncbi:ABC transporter substrate-binding protein [Clostridium saccharobutylicum]|uniref:Multiple sugar-binding protein n=1 Tax=Clostridium saccharobutylicum TaxID=169679 RepID=A0A1S8NBA6_CLOSA|nr:extracellular solute-binding protein [Clostridium saccharobutylicum]OOM13766.1 multiple sugar-binding protein precursor [Clostridium saccharobutylicum]